MLQKVYSDNPTIAALSMLSFFLPSLFSFSHPHPVCPQSEFLPLTFHLALTPLARCPRSALECHDHSQSNKGRQNILFIGKTNRSTHFDSSAFKGSGLRGGYCYIHAAYLPFTTFNHHYCNQLSLNEQSH